MTAWPGLACAAAALALAACGGGGGSAIDAAPADATFKLIQFAPGATGGNFDVPLESPLVARFSRDIDQGSFTRTSFAITEEGANDPVPALLSFPAADSASLRPNAPLRLLGNYTLTLSESLRDIAGRNLARTTSSFLTRDGNWAASPQTLSGPLRAQQPSVTIDGLGNSLVGFTAMPGDTGTPTARVVAYDANMQNWGAITTIGNGQGKASGVKVASNASGAAVAVWVQLNSVGTRAGVFASTKPESGGWSTARSISAGDGLIVGAPEVAMDARGNAIAVWPQDVDVVHAARFDAASGAWNEPLRLSEAATRARRPHIGMAESGDAVVVWAQSTPTPLVQSVRYRASANVWRQDGVLPVTNCVPTSSAPCVIQGSEVDEPRVAVSAGGKAVAVWTERVPGFGHTDIWFNVLEPTGGWDTARKLTTGDRPASRPQVAMDAKGNAYAVWRLWTSGAMSAKDNAENARDTSGRIKSKVAGGLIYAAGPMISPVIVRDAHVADGFGIENLSLAVDPIGHMIAAWEQADSPFGAPGVWAARRAAFGLIWGEPRPIVLEANSPQVAVDTRGRAIAAVRSVRDNFQQVSVSHFR